MNRQKYLELTGCATADDLYTTSVPMVIPGLLEARTWETEGELWLREALRQVETEYPQQDTKELPDGRVETTIQVLRMGSFDQVGGGGKFDVDDRVLADMVKNFHADKGRGVGGHDVFITIGHPWELDGAPAAGWITDLWRAADGLFARVTLNRETVRAIREGEQRYFSPTFTSRGTDDSGRVVGAKLLSGAITNFPFLKGMLPFQLSAVLGSSEASGDLDMTPEQLKQHVTDQVTALGEQLRKDLTKSVSDAVTASATTLEKSLSEKLKPAPNEKPSSPPGDLKELSDKVGKLEGTLTKALTENTRLSEVLSVQGDALRARDVADLLREGTTLGKMSIGEIPGYGTDAFDPLKWLSEDGRFNGIAGLRKYLATAPVVVKLTDRPTGPGHAPVPPAKSKGFVPDDAEAKRLGYRDVAHFEQISAEVEAAEKVS